ncbi:MAG: NAD(P)(+) transhydrogenase (Re/Si-specific) subunit beta, partial [Actinobacteria bacterium]|nr:NAD(P)(+) transhydrogenase (Re/Si-specific) subunit beta [Actinomycetota bacterium]
MNSNLYALIGLGVAVSFVMALKGLSAPKTARRGNLIGAFGATVATVIVFFDPSIEEGHNTILIIAA